jgi:hypothetical protein
MFVRAISNQPLLKALSAVTSVMYSVLTDVSTASLMEAKT